MSCNRLKDSPDVSILRYSSQAKRDFLFIISVEIEISYILK